MKRFLSFDRLFIPAIIQILYVLLSLLIISSGVINFMRELYVPALAILVFGLLGVRLFGELAIAIFRLHENVAQIRNTLSEPGTLARRQACAAPIVEEMTHG